MKPILVIILSILLVSCTTVKKRSESTTMLEQKQSDINVNRQDLVSEKVKEKDSAITVPERKVEGTLSGDQLKPSYNDKGEAKPNTTHIEGKGIDIKATVNKDGSITIKGSCDSLTLIVRNLRTELREKNSKLDSISQQKERIVYVKSEQSSKVKRGFSWGVFAFGFIAGVALVFFLAAFLKVKS